MHKAFEREPVDENWLFARGLLHDARVLKVTRHGADLFIYIDDQWSNFDEAEHPSESGALIVQNALDEFRCDEMALQEMISEVELSKTEAGDVLKIAAFGQHIIEVRGDNVFWQKLETIRP